MPTFCNNLAREDVILAIIAAKGVSSPDYADSLPSLIEDLSVSVGHFSVLYEERRKAVRDILRNGSYKPSGRGKPASEYLVRTITEEKGLPAINGIVDIFNYLSARYQIPISAWDVDACPSPSFEFRLGVEGESFQFNNTGHEIKISDLITGAAINGDSTPVVTPVKDAHAVKISAASRNIAACMYLPRIVVEQTDSDVPAMLLSAEQLLGSACSHARIATGYVGPGDKISLLDD